MTNKKELTTFDILLLWREALGKAVCVKNFHIQGDGKTFDFDLKDESEYNCDDCKSEFCFKSLEWLEDCGDGSNSKLNINTPQRELEYEVMYA